MTSVPGHPGGIVRARIDAKQFEQFVLVAASVSQSAASEADKLIAADECLEEEIRLLT
jgi:hypothetical protein